MKKTAGWIIVLFFFPVLPVLSEIPGTLPSDTSYIHTLLREYPMKHPGKRATKGFETICPGRFVQDSTYFYNWSASDSSWILSRGCFWGYNRDGKTVWYENRNHPENTWVPQSRIENKYSSSGRLLAFYTFYYNSATLSWDSAYKNFYQYTKEGWLATNLSQKYESANTWVNSARYDFEYDSTGHRTLSQSDSWDRAQGKWTPVYRTLDFWEQNLDTTSVRQQYDSAIVRWINSSKRSFYYDDAGRRTKEVLSTWDSVSDQWINQTMILYSYKEGTLTMQDYQTWHTDHWEETVRYLYYQNEAGNDTLILFQIWHTGSATWEDNYRYLYDYDNCNVLKTETGQLWNTSDHTWHNDWLVVHFASPFIPGPPLTVRIVDSANVTCFGGDDGWALAEASGGIPPYHWQWDNNPPSADTLATGLSAWRWYHVTVTDDAGNRAMDSVRLTEPEPVVTGKICGYTQTALYDTAWYFICPPQDGYYTWLIRGGYPLWPTTGPGTIVTWTTPGQDSIGVFLTNISGCSGDTAWLRVMVLPPTSNPKMKPDVFAVWPNPARNQIHIHLPAGPLISPIRLLDISGRICKTKKDPVSPDIILDVHDLPGGTYFLQFRSATSVFLRKVIIR